MNKSYREKIKINGSEVTGYGHEDYYLVTLNVDITEERQTRHNPGGTYVDGIELVKIEHQPSQETEWTDDIQVFRDKLDSWLDSEPGRRTLYEKANQQYQDDYYYDQIQREMDRRI